MIGEQVPLSILAERLSHAEIFGGLGREDLLAIAQFSHEESCREGDIVLEEGQPAYRLFVVTIGSDSLAITASRTSVTRGNQFSVTLKGMPSTMYIVWVENTGQMTGLSRDQPP